MIPTHQVVEAVHAAAQSAPGLNDAPVELHAAPTPAPATYAVVEVPPGGERWGTLGCPSEDATIRVRIRAVARYRDPAAASRVAQRLTGAITAHLLKRSTELTGPTWAADTRTQIADGGVDWSGDVANHVVDLDIGVVARPEPES
jgi:hypothetical protein